MNEFSTDGDTIFQNPDLKPLEDVKLTIKNSGIAQTVPALDEHWVEKKYFLNYEPIVLFDEEGRSIIGAKERWLEVVSYILNDLDWLLRLPFYKFWSNIVYNSRIMDSITIFLQEAPTYYALENFPNDNDLKEHLDRLRYVVLLILARLITNKESPAEYMSLSEHAHLLFQKNIFTVPIFMDICQQYGRNNRKIVNKIVNSAFALEPLYNEDLREAVQFIIKALRDIERRFEDCPIDQEGKAVLLSERGGANVEINLSTLEDLILYLLDTVSTINIFINIYLASINTFKIECFITKIISVYANTIPEMYKRLDDLAFKDETIAKYMELKHRLDVARVEILNIYRMLVYTDVKNTVENKNVILNSETEEIIEDFFNNLTHALSEKEFAIDYHNVYPITDDVQQLIDSYKNIDTMKCEFILNSIFTYLDEPDFSVASTSFKSIPKSLAGPSNSKKNRNSEEVDKNEVAGSSKEITRTKSDVVSIISEIKDILCDLGEGFLEMCLKHYNYNKEAVINAVLEDSLPIELKSLDRNLPFIPPDPEEASATIDNALGMQRLNIYDNDEFDIMTKDNIDTSKIHKGKRKDKYKNFNELLNDKSYIAQTKDIYNKYTIVTNEYDDEYDDTYDDQDIGSSAQDDIVEVDARPFTIPRVLRRQVNNDFEDTEENNDFNHVSETQVNKDNFVQDPALLRAKAEERRLLKQGFRTNNSPTKNVVGNPKGQGQTKEVLDSRNKKGKSKATRANHNRRAGSQWKRSHGMVPS
ncbi:activating signal cointegrator 1 complex subunit 2 [Nasonia vitripennis]|uniref:CUE domain-containing protein n=1 Tax=Nasonia vitripennis TaxID=7425 RepID=A0A7M7QK54_NASVI|nr:activating signal cointegrator 1 complex subunit 2 [Nasonia vitripennis]XP_031788885.1 activating signal cointegrator 1 complex subunit 2 [Nasonia vitripennis]XP_031788886.1 activating signal cointegrator 1 complex subunit 2 [Nasonia vitripennis]XP_031788887.1 activating signal cointegrator 1 complex subunit 2 [Nasonia vitripennis]XP_031788888.1 activating signal cointegrator 1 complex subunit 2 [Nasonia vitripennis]XP_031788890.1 activating signal cointegrator 1 complex subunit 2 [Nasonia 